MTNSAPTDQERKAAIIGLIAASGVPPEEFEEDVAALLGDTEVARKFSEAMRMRSVLLNESDRGAVLVGASYLDEQVEEVLRKFFIDEPKLQEKLLGTSRPLATFSSRIDLCHALGLINEEMAKELHTIREIRNEFAHVSRNIGFEEQRVRDRCKNLRLRPRSATEPEEQFRSSVMGLSAVLHLIIRNTARRPKKPLPSEEDRAKAAESWERAIELTGKMVSIMQGNAEPGAKPPTTQARKPRSSTSRPR